MTVDSEGKILSEKHTAPAVVSAGASVTGLVAGAGFEPATSGL